MSTIQSVLLTSTSCALTWQTTLSLTDTPYNKTLFKTDLVLQLSLCVTQTNEARLLRFIGFRSAAQTTYVTRLT